VGQRNARNTVAFGKLTTCTEKLNSRKKAQKAQKKRRGKN
jgi:hypothetical protein